ncbi:hypothetical protein [Oscillatoria acuminata]|uniref:Uncharacterized protein n=1 Tax=Oscillatoria acuminata PCC 6304 TaxID=56110 RepID=K9TPC7_9CYAN|nr:hypothetical protein [Oscillatoria acuminata]AFY84016.1 hypothetical protein Oscil6304_4499 [Oscillatoria acuminata PCC 6304]
MKFSPAYLQQREEAIQEGIQQGRKQWVKEILKFRFSTIDEELASIIEALVQVSDEEFIPLLLNLSREELLQRFGRSEKL